MTEENKQAAWFDEHKKRERGESSWPANRPKAEAVGGYPQEAMIKSTDVGIETAEPSGASPFPSWDEKREDFPVSKLPERIKGAVIEVCQNDNVPHAVAAQAALSVVSCHGSAHSSHFMIGVIEPPDDRRNGASAGSA